MSYNNNNNDRGKTYFKIYLLLCIIFCMYIVSQEDDTQEVHIYYLQGK